jgi:riboflavin synthase
MFTGLIEDVGKVVRFTGSKKVKTIKIECKKVTEGLQLGDSIAVDGVCLTVTEFDRYSFSAHIMEETMESTALGALRNGSLVNLERAMPANGRFGGHLVSGHVDGVGCVTSIEPRDGSVLLQIDIPPEASKTLIIKGSIAINGISLTIFDLTDTSVTVSIIPHTMEHTSLKNVRVGDHVNLECDMIGKYVYKFFAKNSESEPFSLSKEALMKYGF